MFLYKKLKCKRRATRNGSTHLQASKPAIIWKCLKWRLSVYGWEVFQVSRKSAQKVFWINECCGYNHSFIVYLLRKNSALFGTFLWEKNLAHLFLGMCCSWLLLCTVSTFSLYGLYSDLQPPLKDAMRLKTAPIFLSLYHPLFFTRDPDFCPILHRI